MSVTWDILITSIPHRHDMLCELLAELDGQLIAQLPPRPPSGASRFFPAAVLLYRDNLEVPYGDKTRVLMETSRAEYISCIDDDDTVAPDYARRVLSALETGPDYVGYPVRWTRDGEPQMRVEHSRRHYGWGESPGLVWRDVSEKNPIRRELALLAPFTGGYGADRNWAETMRQKLAVLGRPVIETWIPDEMYYYREVRDSGFSVDRHPMPEPLPPLPRYPWLTVIQP